MKVLILTFVSILFMSSFSGAQTAIDINDANYKFKFSLTPDWNSRKTEETNKQDAISYSYDKTDGKMALMLLAFKVNEVKNLTDFIYTLEKDLTLNIPKIDGTYSEFDKGNYDGMSAKYKDTEFTEIIYYFRTKYSEGVNYAYMLRFITSTSVFNPNIEEEIRKIGDTFEPLPGQ